MGGSNTGWLADNHDHDYCWSTNFTWTSLRTIADDAMDYLESSTDFSGGSHQSCNSGTDVYFQRFNTTDYRGLYQCDDRNGNECDNADVRISSNTETLPTAERGTTTCHEIGHSAGATHPLKWLRLYGERNFYRGDVLGSHSRPHERLGCGDLMSIIPVHSGLQDRPRLTFLGGPWRTARAEPPHRGLWVRRRVR